VLDPYPGPAFGLPLWENYRPAKIAGSESLVGTKPPLNVEFRLLPKLLKLRHLRPLNQNLNQVYPAIPRHPRGIAAIIRVVSAGQLERFQTDA